jgi:hypothetical protein
MYNPYLPTEEENYRVIWLKIYCEKFNVNKIGHFKIQKILRRYEFKKIKI